jgi:uncharacterized protein with PIN domain
MKFLVDAMLGKLARFLRIFGYDALYANDLIDLYHVDPIPDEHLLTYAQQSDRVIITKDYPFYKRIDEKAIYLEGEGIYNYLNQIKEHFGLEFDFNIEKARCTVCNSLLERIEDKTDIINLVQNETYNSINEFYQCRNSECKKIYWKGSHIDDIENKLANEPRLQK